METVVTSAEIELSSVSVAYDKSRSILAELSLSLPAGRITALIGPSGCGKSTLLRLIAGLMRPSQGKMLFRHTGHAAGTTLPVGDLAYVFQDSALLPWRSALQNVCLPMELLGRGQGRERTQLAQQQLLEVGLGDEHWNKMPSQLSGGMRMRVSLARALVTNPSVLLLDEPFASLDDMLRERLGQLVLQLWKDKPRTVVLVTHNIAEAILLSDSIVVMREGRITNQLSVPNVLASRDGDFDFIRRLPEFPEFYIGVSDALRGGLE
jgi:NitT/TauT family transport system ATP-binding protein